MSETATQIQQITLNTLKKAVIEKKLILGRVHVKIGQDQEEYFCLEFFHGQPIDQAKKPSYGLCVPKREGVTPKRFSGNYENDIVMHKPTLIKAISLSALTIGKDEKGILITVLSKDKDTFPCSEGISTSFYFSEVLTGDVVAVQLTFGD